jgi:signal transduction histidine kinase
MNDARENARREKVRKAYLKAVEAETKAAQEIAVWFLTPIVEALDAGNVDEARRIFSTMPLGCVSAVFALDAFRQHGVTPSPERKEVPNCRT